MESSQRFLLRQRTSSQESSAAVAYPIGQRLAVNSLTVKRSPVYLKLKSRVVFPRAPFLRQAVFAEDGIAIKGWA